MALVYVEGTLSANHHARPFTNPFPFAETCSGPKVSCARAVGRGTYQVAHDPSVKAGDGDAEYRSEDEEERMQGEEEPLFSRPSARPL